MSEFVNDPELAPGQVVLCGRRDVSGSAFSWEPGGEIDAFLAFVGSHLFAVVDGKLYKREGDGTLTPFDVSTPMIVVKPMAGDPFFHSPAEFKRTYSVIVTPVVPLPSSLMFSPGFVSEPTSAFDEPHKLPADASGALPAVDAADEASAPPLLAPGEGTPARKPGRPKVSTNKASQS